jgi:hypothetical protein
MTSNTQQGLITPHSRPVRGPSRAEAKPLQIAQVPVGLPPGYYPVTQYTVKIIDSKRFQLIQPDSKVFENFTYETTLAGTGEGPPSDIAVQGRDGSFRILPAGTPLSVNNLRDGDRLYWPQRQQTIANPVQQPSTSIPSAQNISQWSTSDKLTEAMKLSVHKVDAKFRDAMAAFVTPENLKLMGGILAAWGAAHLFGAGQAADAIVLGAGAIALGADVFKAGQALWEYFEKAQSAQTPQELEQAAERFAEFVNIVGVNALSTMAGAKLGNITQGLGKLAQENWAQIGKLAPETQRSVGALLKAGRENLAKVGKPLDDLFVRGLRQMDTVLAQMGLRPQPVTAEGVTIDPAFSRQNMATSGGRGSNSTTAQGSGATGAAVPEQRILQVSGKPLFGRKFDDLSQAEKNELGKEYFIYPEGGRPIFRRRDITTTPSIHAELNQQGEWIIRPDAARANSRISQFSAALKNFEAMFGKRPDAHQIHHLLADNLAQTEKILIIARRKGAFQIDQGNNLIAAPETVAAFKSKTKAIQDLQDKDGLVKLIHSGSHPQWDTYVSEQLNLLSRRLERTYGSLEKVPTDVLKDGINGVLKDVRQVMIQESKSGLRQSTVDWIQPSKQDPKFPKLGQQPAEPPSVTTASAPPPSPTPRALLDAQAFVEHQLKRKGYVPDEDKFLSIVLNHKSRKAELIAIQQSANQAQRIYETLQSKSEPSLRNLFGLLNDKSKLDRARDNYRDAAAEQYNTERTFAHHDRTFQEARQSVQHYLE